MVRFTIDVNVPKVSLKISRKVDKFRRYLPRNIKWKKFHFDFNPEKYSCYETDLYYNDLVASIIRGCEKMNISFRKRLKDFEINRFEMSDETKDLKNLLQIKKDAYLILKSKKKFVYENLENYGEDIIQNLNFLYDTIFEDYKKTRNKYNRFIKKDQQNYIRSSFKKAKTNLHALWQLVNRAKGQVTGQVEDFDDNEFGNEAMAKFYYFFKNW